MPRDHPGSRLPIGWQIGLRGRLCGQVFCLCGRPIALLASSLSHTLQTRWGLPFTQRIVPRFTQVRGPGARAPKIGSWGVCFSCMADSKVALDLLGCPE
jgi:hypothetical protein